MKVFSLWLVVLFTLAMPVCAIAQGAAKTEPPKILSIADKTKYQVMQLELSGAVKDVQYAQLQAQQATQQIISEPIRTLNAKIAEVLRSLGVVDSDLSNWIYNPDTYTFTRKGEPAKSAPPQETNKK